MRGLMNSWAPISGLVCPSRASRATWTSWGVSASRVVRGEPARGLAGGQQLAAGALGERLGPEAAEVGVGAAQLLARVRAAVLAPQPLAVQEPAAGEFDRRAAAREPLDRLAVERLVVVHQRAAARFDPERPLGAAGLRAFAQALERGGGLVRLAGADARPRSARPAPSRTQIDVLVLAGPLRGRERLAVVAVAVVQQRDQPPVRAKRRALAALPSRPAARRPRAPAPAPGRRATRPA